MTGKICVDGLYSSNNASYVESVCKIYYGYLDEEGANEAWEDANKELRKIIKFNHGRLEQTYTRFYKEFCGRLGAEEYECNEIRIYPTIERTAWDKLWDGVMELFKK